ncbi:MAG: LysR family transcriptional regulator [Epulopiscium sp.]|nr:LysR family transcriptional regulator [Candidatus Epulonipiscium sp.]
MKVDISLDLYKIFCAVVRTGNMSAAAKELYISQPAVSMSIRQLEDRMGSPLLIRTAKGVRTTQEGGVLYEYLEQALGLIQTAEKKYFELVNLQAGELRIGASDTVLSSFLLPYLEKYHQMFPEITIKVTNKTSYESLKLLKSGKVDLCFVNLPIEEDDDLEMKTCMEIQDCLVGGVAYQHLCKDGIHIRDIGEYPLLLLEELSNSRRFIDQYAQENGVVLKPILELGSSDLLVQFAKIGLGLTFVIRDFNQEALESQQIYEIPLLPAVPRRGIGMVRLKNVALSHAAKGFLDLL